MNAKISVFAICVKAVIYLLLYDLRDCTFKGNKDLISYFVYNKFNKALSRSQYPNSLKYAYVTLAFKMDDKSDKSSYGPISILPNPSKVYERIMQNQFYPYLNNFF